jgi:hypothetical protein
MSASIGTKIDHVINETERALSIVAFCPVIGTVAGLSKALMGVAQLIVGVVGGIFTLPARCMNNPQLNDRFWTHTKHGAANIVAGVLEAIPFLGTYIYINRTSKHEGSTLDAYVKTGHLDKYMPYESLLEADLEIAGYDNDQTEAVLNFQKEAKNLSSYEERLQLAKDTVQGINDKRHFPK